MVSIGTLLAFVYAHLGISFFGADYYHIRMVDTSVLVQRYSIPEKGKSAGWTLAFILIFVFFFLVSVVSEWHFAISLIAGLIALVPITLLFSKV